MSTTISLVNVPNIQAQALTRTEKQPHHLHEVLTLLIQRNHVTLTALHKNTGIPLATLKRIQSDPQANPTIATLIPLANFFNININQLLGLELLPAMQKGYRLNIQHWTKVPLINWQQAITWPDHQPKEDHFVLTDVDINEHGFALRVEEADWVDFMPGAILIIDPQIKPEHKDYVIVYKVGMASPTMKQLVFDEDRQYVKSLNLTVQPNLVEKQHIFLGVLVQIKMDIK